MVRRAALQDLLLDAVAGERHIDARFGATVTGAGPDGKVQVETVDGPAALKADLVIGADGVHSRIRAAADFGARVSRPGIAYLRALVEGVEAHGVEAWTAAGLFGSFPVDRGVYLYASAGTPACRDAVEARDLDALRAVWRRAWPQSAPLLDRVGRFEDLIVNRVVRVDCRRWHDGRIVLVGDAAHAMAPNLGQGGNSALVDAAVLLDALREAPTLGEALAAYEARRRPAVRRVARLAGRLGALAELTNPALRFMRDRVLMPLVARVSRGDTTATVMQERPDRLLAIGRSA
jgi:2-polyprenyl-6-methoxyphenol hydroxylase-like FAD-dependent oxidoreductase